METSGPLSLGLAFLAGIASFAGPCIFPLIPAYLSFVSGESVETMRIAGVRRRTSGVLLKTLVFVLGFTTVFTILGASLSFLGSLIGAHRDAFRIVGGLLVIVFGLHVAGAFRLPFLALQKRIPFPKSAGGWLAPFLVGCAFAIGWTPCVGPALSSILILASNEETIFRGMLLLIVYSLGIGLPFLITAALFDRALVFFAKAKKFMRAVEIVSGLVLIATGILIFTNKLTMFL